MTCTYGGAVKAGVSSTAQVVISRSAWEVLTSSSSSWLDAILDTFTPSVVLVSDLCAANPADPANLALSTIAAALVGNPAAILDVEQWVKEKLTYYEFTQLCVCQTGPSICGLQQEAAGGWTNFGGGSPTNEIEGFRFTAHGTLCLGGWLYTGTGAGWSSQVVDLWDVTAGTKMTNATVNTPGGANSVAHFAWGASQTLVSGHDYIYGIEKPIGNNYPGKSPHASPSNPTYYTAVSQVYSTSFSVMPATASGAEIGLEPEICAPTTPPPPVATTQPTQPSDLILPTSWTCTTTADLCTRLQQLSDRLDWLRRDVTLIQRQAVPFGYLTGTVHSGLTGSGTLTVQGLIGLLVQIATVPSWWGSSSDFPARYIPAPAMVAVGDAAGDQDTHFCHLVEELVFPPNMGLCTKVKYEFKPGCGGAITELLREP